MNWYWRDAWWYERPTWGTAKPGWKNVHRDPAPSLEQLEDATWRRQHIENMARVDYGSDILARLFKWTGTGWVQVQ